MTRLRTIITSLVLFLPSCAAAPGVVQTAPDTFMIFKEDKAGIFGSSAKLKADTIREANDFAAKQGKIAIPISMKETPMFPGHFATFEYQFRVVGKDDPEARRTSIVPRPDVVVEKNERVTVDTPTGKVSGEAPAASGAAISIDCSVPNADVFVDGKFVGNSPLPNYRMSTGTHTIEVRAVGYQTWKRELAVAENASSRVVATLEKSQQ